MGVKLEPRAREAVDSPVSVNGVAIPASAIDLEMQHHPAPTRERARREALQALVIRALLLQEARRLGLKPEPRVDDAKRRETDDEALVREVVETAVTPAAPDEAAVRGYYQRHRPRFRSPALFEASHILFSAAPDDTAACAVARRRAEQMARQLARDPARFEELARAGSDCSSGADGGRLGQVASGAIAPQLESVLAGLEPGQLHPHPVHSRHGFHLLRLERRESGRVLPFEAVREKISAYLGELAWRRAVKDYLGELVAAADVHGWDWARSPNRESA